MDEWQLTTLNEILKSTGDVPKDQTAVYTRVQVIFTHMYL